MNSNNGNGQTITMSDNKTTLQALALINDCNKYKMDLTTNGVVITDAINLVQTKEKLTMSTKKEDNGSKENEEQLEKSQEEKTREIEQETTNHIFDLLTSHPFPTFIYRGHIYEISVSALHQKIIIPCQLKTKKYPL